MLKCGKGIFTVTLFVLFLTQYTYAENKYPYQAPGRFNNDYQKSNYYLAGDIYFYTTFLPEVAQNKHFETSSPLINPNSQNSYRAQFKPNTSYSIFSLFYRKGDEDDCLAYRLPKQFSEMARVIFRSPDMISYPLIALTRKSDSIQIYVGNPQKRNLGGTKLTFNIHNFENYMKTTAWYNSLEKLNDRKRRWKDSAITFGFAINADDFNFNVPLSVAQSFSLNVVDIVGAARWAHCSDEERFRYIKTIIPFNQTLKIAESDTKNSIDDLYIPHTINWQGNNITIPPIVTIEKMNQNDFEELQNLVKLGNSN